MAENEMPNAADLGDALDACVDLIEGWAYGPLFKAAGVEWPNGVCQAPALMDAKTLLRRIGRLR